MRSSDTGLLAGLLLGLAMAFGGFAQMLVVAFFGALGLLAAKVLMGEVDVSEYVNRRSR